MFPDSVIIYNDGRLPENWTVNNLLEKHRSRPYNPKIAYAFYRVGYIETWGRGIERITTACKDAGKREPLFEVTPGEVSVTFFIDVNDKGDKKFVEKFVENDVQRTIIRLMLEQPTISAKAIAEKIGMSSRGVQKNIDTLKKQDW